MANTEYILELQHVTKRFNKVAANKDINLKIKRGEIHALLGENGAGKSTLMNILIGLYIPDEGKILFNGKEEYIKNPRYACCLGIGMVHQHFKLVETLSVAENILMGHEDLGRIIRKRKLYKKLMDVTEKFNLPIQPEAIVSKLSAGEMQRVEIVKMLYRDVDLLILDEPTSVLTPQESQELFKNLMQMKEQGKTVIFISHKLNEVIQIADRVTILRRGEVIKTMNKEDTNAHELAHMMVGREMRASTRKKTLSNGKGDAMLKVDNISAVGEKRQLLLDNVSLEVASGEILGIAGVSGNGQSQLAECLTGLHQVTCGAIYVDKQELTNKNPQDFINAGVSHVPEDRIGVGCVADFTCYENIISKSYDRAPVRKGGMIDQKEVVSFGNRLMREFDVRMATPYLPIRFLSGGNIQKLIFAREINENPKVIVAVHPTYGLDVSAVERVHDLLLEQQKKGYAILLISEDLDELFEVSDQIAVMYKGSLTQKKANDQWTLDALGYAMMGLADAGAQGEGGGEIA